MQVTQAKQLAHELTIEYIRTNQSYLKGRKPDSIPEIVDDFAKVYQRFYNAIIANETLSKL